MTRLKDSIWLAGMLAGAALGAGTLGAATFGRVVAIGGQASDLVLDEPRGVAYVANFTANRVEVMSLADGSIQTSMNVASQPSAVGLSPDGRFLVVGHYGNFTSPGAAANGITVVDLNSRGRQTFATRSPVLGLAFGADNRALVVSAADFQLFDPVSGVFEVVDTVANLTANPLPAQGATGASAIVAASVAASGDGRRVFGLTDTFVFRYDVAAKQVRVTSYISSPTMGPRSIAVARDGSSYMGGWVLHSAEGHNVSQLSDVQGTLDFGSNAFDSDRNLVYAQYARQSLGQPFAQKPVLNIMDADNLRLRERIQLPEHLAGKSAISSDGSVVYAVSASGVAILPVGAIDRAPRVAATEEEIVIRGTFCDRRVASQEIGIVSRGGGAVDFSLASNTPGVRVSPSSGVTPATVRITVDPSYFQNLRGTVAATIDISSNGAVNVPGPIRVVLNNREPDQRGTVVNVPGNLVDMVADPGRDRFYILRQDTNEVLVYDGTSYAQVARLRTANTPTQLAVTFDRRYLLAGHENAQIITVYDLETLEQQAPVVMPRGHYPRSVAASGKAILAASRVGGNTLIDRVDLATRSAVLLPSLGVFTNQLFESTTLVASPNGGRIMAVSGNGTVALYDANADTFTVSRKIAEKISGAYAASSYDQFVAGNLLLNASLVPTRTLDGGASVRNSGFAFVDDTALRLTQDILQTTTTTAPPAVNPVPGATPNPAQQAPQATAPAILPAGVINRMDLPVGQGVRATRIAEAPFQGTEQFPFTRTLAPLASRASVVVLTVSGFTVLPWNYDAAVAVPVIDRVANAADGSSGIATGGLVTVSGRNLSPVNIATRELPLPTALGESCLTVNGVPTPVLFVSPNQINAQIPFNVDGSTTMVLRTPGGISDNHNLVVRPAAPAVFRAAEPLAGTPIVVRARNNELVTLSNPIHRGDAISIYLTGMGKTAPEVEAGVPGPANPPAWVVTPAQVTVGGHSAEVTFAGLAPGQVGVYQINATVSRGAPLGADMPLRIEQGAASSTVSVRVVE